jgi:hypothetical protein
MRIDVHQHLWSEPLLDELARRHELPFVRQENGLTVLYLVGERPYVIDKAAEASARRSELVERDGLDRALICLSSPIGIERLARAQAEPLIDAYHDGALTLGNPFGAWAAIALDRPEPADIDRALRRGCVGLSLPADAIGEIESLHAMQPLLDRLEQLDAPLFIHPGAGREQHRQPSLSGPLWWPALTSYVSQLQRAWLAFNAVGRAAHPRLRVIFSMLAGLAPLHGERLRARGGRLDQDPDPLVFYETSSYGPVAIRALAGIVGPQQILYGSDRPVVEPGELGMPDALDWAPVIDASQRALAVRRPQAVLA